MLKCLGVSRPMHVGFRMPLALMWFYYPTTKKKCALYGRMYLHRNRRFMAPRVWGKAFWDYMFALALHARLSRRMVKKHFELFACLIPCALCRCNFMSHLKSHPPPPSGMSLFRWIHTLKNAVNKRQREIHRKNKPDLEFEDAVRRHKKMNCAVTIREFCNVLKKTMPREKKSIPAKYRSERRVNARVFREKHSKFMRQLNKFFRPTPPVVGGQC